MGNRHWTQEEISALRTHWPSSKQEKIIQVIPGRSYEAIRIKAKDLGIRRSIPAFDRFISLVEIDDKTRCWNWIGHAIRNEYGTFKFNGKSVKAYRWSYEFFFFKIGKGLTIDHLCRNTKCVNPFHLEPVTHRTNVLRGDGPAARNARKTHCDRGHEFFGKNLMRVGRQKKRRCRRCHNENARNRRKTLALR